MKYKFFKDSTALYSFILCLLLSTIFLVFIIIETFGNHTYISVVFLFMYILVITLTILTKAFQAKIILTSKGIEEKLYKKQIRFLMWEEIATAYISNIYRSRYITLIIRNTNEKLEFEINKRRLNNMRDLCSNEELKKKLFSIKLSIFNQKYGI